MTKKIRQSDFLDLLSIQRDWLFTEYLPQLESMPKEDRRKESSFILQVVSDTHTVFTENQTLTQDQDKIYRSEDPVLFTECMHKYIWQSVLLKIVKHNKDLARKLCVPLLLSILTESPHSNHVDFDDYEDLADLMGLRIEEFQEGIAISVGFGLLHITNQNYTFTLPQSFAESSWQVVS